VDDKGHSQIWPALPDRSSYRIKQSIADRIRLRHLPEPEQKEEGEDMCGNCGASTLPWPTVAAAPNCM